MSAFMSAAFLKARSRQSYRSSQPTKFEFVVNQQTAKTLGLRIPPALLTAADKVIDSSAECPLLALSRHSDTQNVR